MTRERDAILDHWRRDALARPLGGVLDLDGAQAHSLGIPVAQWNGLLLRRAAAPEVYAAAAAWFAEQETPWGIVVPDELDHAPPGGRHLLELPVWTRALDDLPAPPPLRYDAAPSAQQVADVQTAAFGDPPGLDLQFVRPVLDAPWRRTVVVREAAVPVATACVSLGEHGEAVVFDVAVVPEAQRRGLGRAVTLWCLHQAAGAGCDLVLLNPSTAGRPLYEGLGFRPAPSWQVWSPS